MRTETEHTIFLKDYAPTPYKVDKVELDVRIAPDTSRVRALLTLTPRSDTAPGTPLVLDGDELKIRSIAIDAAVVDRPEEARVGRPMRIAFQAVAIILVILLLMATRK